MSTQSLSYSVDQIDRYLQRIAIAPRFQRSATPKNDLEYLTALQRHQLSTIAFENLSLHYSTDHSVSLDPQVLFTRVIDGGLGGYCMQANRFFEFILRGLGFNVYSTGARPKPRVRGVPVGDFRGWTHMVNIVILDDGSRYLVDVGFGGDGPIQPMPLVEKHISRNIGEQAARVMKKSIGIDTSQQIWIYQIRNQPDSDWSDVYCFSELEFLLQDYMVMSHYVNTHPASFMTTQIIVVKMLSDGENIYGKIMLDNATLKKNTGGRSEVVTVCETEEERIEVLRKHFDIVLSDAETAGIHGMNTQLVA